MGHQAPHRGSVRLLTAVLLGIVLIGGQVSCATRTRGAAPVRTTGAGVGPEAAVVAPGAPVWALQPHSWGKLDAVESWLRTSPGADPYWRIEGQLQLAEGQLRFARQDRSPGTTDQVANFRSSSALAGFETVLANTNATEDQQRRARSGARDATSGLTPGTSEGPGPPGAEILGLIPRARWKAARPNPRNMARSSGRWSWITVHHSVFSSSSNSLEDSLDTVRRIQREHIQGQKYADIGYHYLIDRAGRVIEGRSLRWQGAHAGGANNIGNVGICLLGNFDEEQPTQAAIGSLNKLVFELQNKLRIPRKNVRPHRAWKETDCPGKHLMPWFARG